MTAVIVFQIVNVILLIINLVFVWLNVRNAGSPSLYMTSDYLIRRLISGEDNPVHFYLGNGGPGVARGVKCYLYVPKVTTNTGDTHVSYEFYFDALEPKSRFNIANFLHSYIPGMAGYLFEVEQKRYPLIPAWVPRFGKEKKVSCYVFDGQGRLVAPRELGEDPCKRKEKYMDAINDGDENKLWEARNSK